MRHIPYELGFIEEGDPFLPLGDCDDNSCHLAYDGEEVVVNCDHEKCEIEAWVGDCHEKLTVKRPPRPPYFKFSVDQFSAEFPEGVERIAVGEEAIAVGSDIFYLLYEDGTVIKVNNQGSFFRSIESLSYKNGLFVGYDFNGDAWLVREDGEILGYFRPPFGPGIALDDDGIVVCDYPCGYFPMSKIEEIMVEKGDLWHSVSNCQDDWWENDWLGECDDPFDWNELAKWITPLGGNASRTIVIIDGYTYAPIPEKGEIVVIAPWGDIEDRIYVGDLNYISTNGDLIVAYGDSYVTLIDRDGEVIDSAFIIKPRNGIEEVTAAAINPAGDRLLVADTDAYLTLFEITENGLKQLSRADYYKEYGGIVRALQWKDDETFVVGTNTGHVRIHQISR